MNQKRVIVLLSGGLDSVVALHHAATTYTVAATLSFDYGSKHNHRELPFAASQSRDAGVSHRVVDLNFFNDLFASNLLSSGADIPDGHYAENTMRQTVVPFRNGIMLAIAAGYAESIGCDGVLIAAHAGDHTIYPDCREEFMHSMGQAMSIGSYSHTALLRPFINKTKAEIVMIGHELGLEFRQTWSCYKGGATHCGTCGTCTERREAFILARVPDPTDYEQIPALPQWPELCDSADGGHG